MRTKYKVFVPQNLWSSPEIQAWVEYAKPINDNIMQKWAKKWKN